MIDRILFTESSNNLGGQELQALQQMIALENKGINTSWAKGVASSTSPICLVAISRIERGGGAGMSARFVGKILIDTPQAA